MDIFKQISFYLVLCFYFTLTMASQSVLELSDNDFRSTLAEQETALVMFYAPWCGHCKKLKPEFDKAGGLLRSNDPPIVLAKVDCTEAGKETCSEYQVTGYPTLKIFSKGELLKEYEGPRDASGIVKYMQAQVGPSSRELLSLADFEKFIGKDQAVVIGFFPKETDLKGAFLQIANKLREKLNFAHTAVEEILKKQGIEEGIQLVRPKILNNKFEDDVVSYSGGNQLSDIDAWIKKNYHGLVGLRTTENAEDFKPPVIVTYYNVDYVKNPKGTNYWRNRILKVAKDYSGKYSFAISAKDDFQHELNEFGYDYVPSDKPIVFAKGENKEKFVMKENFSVETLAKFVNDLEKGKVTPFLKSEEIPADNTGPVKIAVAKNFDDVVLKNGKDTLIEFYAPWCGHCKKLQPIFEKLGEKMKDEDVEIVKMDATANDVPQPFDVRGFPTLFWLPKNEKNKPVPYEGGRELVDFVKYIAQHATDELHKFNRKGKAKDAKDEL